MIKKDIKSGGIININKPQQWTSHDCVALLRRRLGIKRIGHTGTLDPMATGVLPLCVGRGTKIIEYLEPDIKKYLCTLQLGIETDTLDIWGNVTSKGVFFGVTEEQIQEAVKSFRGEISQIPPKYSAIKVKGRKLYEYARAGQEVEIKPRSVYIEKTELLHIDLDRGLVTFTVDCSKGTYIRSMCRDIGQLLGCGASMAGLVRTGSGRFAIEDAADIETIKVMEKDEIIEMMVPVDYPLTKLGEIQLDTEKETWFLNGRHIDKDDLLIVKEPIYKGKQTHIKIKKEIKEAYRVYCGKNFLGTGRFDDKDKLKTGKIITEVSR